METGAGERKGSFDLGFICAVVRSSTYAIVEHAHRFPISPPASRHKENLSPLPLPPHLPPSHPHLFSPPLLSPLGFKKEKRCRKWQCRLGLGVSLSLSLPGRWIEYGWMDGSPLPVRHRRRIRSKLQVPPPPPLLLAFPSLALLSTALIFIQAGRKEREGKRERKGTREETSQAESLRNCSQQLYTVIHQSSWFLVSSLEKLRHFFSNPRKRPRRTRGKWHKDPLARGKRVGGSLVVVAQ